jgi:aryl-alcohol dehydrogenase-like predicted oxidoreductase
MRTVPLGSTGLRVSTMGLGLAALGRPGYINLGRQIDLGSERTVAALERNCHALLDAAAEAGITYVDAARSYGLAENFLASWLERRGLAPGTITVGSKWGYTYTGRWQVDASVHEVKDHSIATLQRQIRESRALLGSHLQLFQIHSATLESGVLDDTGVLGELARLRSEGLVIGLTVSGPRQGDVIRRALEVSVDGLGLFQVVQATWNLLEVSAGPALADAHARGWGVIIKEALANGRLTDRHADRASEPVQRQAAALGQTFDGLALAAALSQPWAHVVLSGAVTAAQLQSNLQASHFAVTPGSLPSIEMAPVRYWSERAALEWK